MKIILLNLCSKALDNCSFFQYRRHWMWKLGKCFLHFISDPTPLVEQKLFRAGSDRSIHRFECTSTHRAVAWPPFLAERRVGRRLRWSPFESVAHICSFVGCLSSADENQALSMWRDRCWSQSPNLKIGNIILIGNIYVKRILKP